MIDGRVHNVLISRALDCIVLFKELFGPGEEYHQVVKDSYRHTLPRWVKSIVKGGIPPSSTRRLSGRVVGKPSLSKCVTGSKPSFSATFNVEENLPVEGDSKQQQQYLVFPRVEAPH